MQLSAGLCSRQSHTVTERVEGVCKEEGAQKSLPPFFYNFFWWVGFLTTAVTPVKMRKVQRQAAL